MNIVELYTHLDDDGIRREMERIRVMISGVKREMIRFYHYFHAYERKTKGKEKGQEGNF